MEVVAILNGKWQNKSCLLLAVLIRNSFGIERCEGLVLRKNFGKKISNEAEDKAKLLPGENNYL
jgi:hypothetical protein